MTSEDSCVCVCNYNATMLECLVKKIQIFFLCGNILKSGPSLEKLEVRVDVDLLTRQHS